MIKLKLTTFAFGVLMVFLISCNSSTIDHKSKDSIRKSKIENAVTDSVNSDDSTLGLQTQIDSSALAFVESLKNGDKLSPFFAENLIFIYHEDNRCDGSTDGQIGNLLNTQIDSVIKLPVKNDGDAWACDKKEPTTFEIDFDLKKKVTNWDRFEIPDYGNQEEKVVYVLGAGESDYLKLHYNDNRLIIKLEYRSEDPG